jgi:hypothetical protein
MPASSPQLRVTPVDTTQAEAPDDERPTVVPDFDPEAFARDSEIRTRVPALGEGDTNIDRARRLHLDGDDEQALFLLTPLLGLAPLHPEAIALSAECRAALEGQCLAVLGSESAVLAVAVTAQELRRFELDNVSGFLLSLIDGATSVESILDLSGLPRLLALRHLRNLFERGIVLGPRHRAH